MDIKSYDLDGERIRVGVTHGSSASPPLLLFNGIGANIELVVPFAERMEALGIGMIVFDVPGVGGSSKPAGPYRFSRLAKLAAGLTEELGIEGSIDVMGVSWGGALAQQFARQFPRLCRRLVLAATSPGAIMVPGKLSALTKLVNPRRYMDPDFMARIGGELYGGAFRSDPELLRLHGRHISAPSGLGYVYQLLAGAGWTSLPWLHRLGQPTLVMMGTDDPIIPVVNGRILAALIPDARLELIDDGHLFMISRADEVARRIFEFLTEPAPGTR